MQDEPYVPATRHSPRLLLLVFLLLGAVLLWRFLIGPSFTNRARRSEPRIVQARGDLAEDEKATIELFRVASPATVYVTSTTTVRERGGFFRRNLREIPSGSGSGFIWDEAGHVVTNYHVIRGGEHYAVMLHDQSVYRAKLVGAEPSKDLAVLKIDARAGTLTPLALGTSHDLVVGQKVFAIGNPFGLDQTLTTGIISGLGREIDGPDGRPIQDVIQTDAAINPGNSGGPLLDSAGRLIGVNTAIVSPSGAYAGVGFAVPVDTVNSIVPQLIEHGKVTRPGLGIVMAPERWVRNQGFVGVLVDQVLEGGAADRAGLRSTLRDRAGNLVLGDLIVALDGEKIQTQRDLFLFLDRHSVGDEVEVTVARPEGETRLTLELQGLP